MRKDNQQTERTLTLKLMRCCLRVSDLDMTLYDAMSAIVYLVLLYSFMFSLFCTNQPSLLESPGSVNNSLYCIFLVKITVSFLHFYWTFEYYEGAVLMVVCLGLLWAPDSAAAAMCQDVALTSLKLLWKRRERKRRRNGAWPGRSQIRIFILL